MARYLAYTASFFLLGSAAFSQTLQRTVISAGGGTGSNANLTLAYNIGEPVAELFLNQNANQALYAGFIQGDIDIATFLSNNISSQLVLFPNPVISGIAKLDFLNVPDGRYQIDIVDAVGHVLYTKTIAYAKDNNLKVDLSVAGFKGGTYFVRVRNGNVQGQIKLVKI